MLSVKALYKKLCQLSISYYDGKHWRFGVNGDKVTLEEIDQPASVVIVSREFYQETVQRYPVDDLKEINRILALELNSPDKVGKIAYKGEGYSLVNLWQFHGDCINARVLVPVSWLLSTGLSNGKVQSWECNKRLFLAKSNGACYSTLESALIKNASVFALSVGISEAGIEPVKAQNDFAKVMLTQFSQLSPQALLRFVRKPNENEKKSWVLKVGLPVALIYISYLAMTSGYLLWKEDVLNEKLVQHSEQVNDALTIQNEIDENLAKYQNIESFLENKSLNSTIWIIVRPLFEKVTFSNIRTVNGRVALRGTTAHATLLLEELSKHRLVEDAKFDFPTRKRKDMEIFVISFVMKDDVEIATDFGQNDELATTDTDNK
ncbi:hypothetical protein [Thalassotalea fusca]